MISIIITFHNQEKFVDECLLSFLNQTVQDELQIIAIDDASTDRTEYEIKKHDNVQYHKVNFKNVTKSRNYGLKWARGDYVCFFDGDDYVYPRYLELLQKAIKDNKADFAYARYTVTESLSPFHRCNHLEFEPSFLRYGNIINTPTMLKKECLKRISWDETIQIMEDWELMINLTKSHFVGVPVYDVLWHYRIHKDSSWNGKKLKQSAKDVRDYIHKKHGIDVERLKYSIYAIFSYNNDDKMKKIKSIHNRDDTHAFIVINSTDTKLRDAIKRNLPKDFGSIRIFFTNTIYEEEILDSIANTQCRMQSVSGSDYVLKIN